MSEREKIIRLIRETGELRRELLATGIEGGTLTVELSNQDLAAIVYALSSCWIAEYVAGEPGYENMLAMIGDASATILVADSGPAMDKALEQILRGQESPEEAADGA